MLKTKEQSIREEWEIESLNGKELANPVDVRHIIKVIGFLVLIAAVLTGSLGISYIMPVVIGIGMAGAVIIGCLLLSQRMREREKYHNSKAASRGAIPFHEQAPDIIYWRSGDKVGMGGTHIYRGVIDNSVVLEDLSGMLKECSINSLRNYVADERKKQALSDLLRKRLDFDPYNAFLEEYSKQLEDSIEGGLL